MVASVFCDSIGGDTNTNLSIDNILLMSEVLHQWVGNLPQSSWTVFAIKKHTTPKLIPYLIYHTEYYLT